MVPADFPFAQLSEMSTKESESDGRGTAEPTSPPIVTGFGPVFDSIANKYPSVFDGNCKIMKGEKLRIEVDPLAVPVSTGASRTIPEPLLPALRKELDTLLAQGIIEPVEEATPWLHSIVLAPKKGTSDVRLCVDFSKLNKHIIRPVNAQPTLWELVRKIPKGTKHFAVFDALKGYHQIELDDESKNLTAFLTPFGRFRYLRLPFGLNLSGDCFTKRYGDAVDQVPDTKRVVEDSLILGSTGSQLAERAEAFVKQCSENNITLNLRKVQWDCPEVLFGGFIVDSEGYRIDPSLSDALRNFSQPKNVTDVRAFFGLANQTCNFSDEISEMLLQLKPLLKKGIVFQWLPEHEEAFDKAKEHLSSSKSLAYYNSSRPTRLQVDASRLFGLGFVLKQETSPGVWQTVQAGSRFLSDAETRYAMIELEMLAIAWACKKWSMFIEGLTKAQFTIWTDHQPLVPIHTSYSLPQIENRRLQRLRMKVDHLQFSVQWVRGKDNVEADALSRAPCAKATHEDEIDEDLSVSVSSVVMNGINWEVSNTDVNDSAKDLRLVEIEQFAEKDQEYRDLAEMIKGGFPNAKANMPERLKGFWQARKHLHLDEDGLIQHGERLFIPTKLRATILDRLLAMHQAADKMLARARQCIWWPFLTNDIHTAAAKCRPCQELKPSLPREPLRHHKLPEFPFQYLHADLAIYEGHQFLNTVDQYSGFPHLFEMGKSAPA